MKKSNAIKLILYAFTFYLIAHIYASSANPEQPALPSKSFLDIVGQGGLLMIPLFILLFIAVVIVIERFLFILIKKSWSLNTIHKELHFASTKIKSQFREDVEEELRYYLEGYMTKTEKGLNLLYTIGNLAPLYGFFGTVVGMIEAFGDIAAAADINAQVVATGIKTALLTTAGGLAVALVCFVFHGIFMYMANRIEESAKCYVELYSMNKPRLSDILGRYIQSDTLTNDPTADKS